MSHTSWNNGRADSPEDGETALNPSTQHRADAASHGAGHLHASTEEVVAAVRERRLRLKNETRFGIAALLSFLILVTVLFWNRDRLRGKSAPLAGGSGKAPPIAKIDPTAGQSRIADAPATTAVGVSEPAVADANANAKPMPETTPATATAPGLAAVVDEPTAKSAPAELVMLTKGEQNGAPLPPEPAPAPAPAPASDPVKPVEPVPTPSPAPAEPPMPPITAADPGPAPTTAPTPTAPAPVERAAPAPALIADSAAPVTDAGPALPPVPAATPAPAPLAAPATAPAPASVPAPDPALPAATAMPATTSEASPAPSAEVPTLSPTPVPVAVPVAVPTATPAVAATDRADFVPLPNVGRRRAVDVDDPRAAEPPAESFDGPGLRVDRDPPAVVVSRTPKRTEAPEQVEPVAHVVQRGENFWTISRLYYGYGRFWKALWSANQATVSAPEALYVGQTVRIPPPEALDRSLIEAERPARSSRADRDASTTAGSTLRRASRDAGAAPRVASAEARGEVEIDLPTSDPFARRRATSASDPSDADADAEPSPPPPRRSRYKVRPYETLRSIARDTLGDSRRAGEILDLNSKVVDDPAHLIPGQVIELPADAKLGLGGSRRGR